MGADDELQPDMPPLPEDDGVLLDVRPDPYPLLVSLGAVLVSLIAVVLSIVALIAD